MLAAARAAEAERRERRQSRRDAVARVLPRPALRPAPGLLAQRRRRQVTALVVLLVLVNLLVVAFTVTWAPRALALAVSVIAAPMLYTVLFRRS